MCLEAPSVGIRSVSSMKTPENTENLHCPSGVCPMKQFTVKIEVLVVQEEFR